MLDKIKQPSNAKPSLHERMLADINGGGWLYDETRQVYVGGPRDIELTAEHMAKNAHRYVDRLPTNRRRKRNVNKTRRAERRELQLQADERREKIAALRRHVATGDAKLIEVRK